MRYKRAVCKASIRGKYSLSRQYCTIVPRLSVQLFSARSKISGQRAWENSSRELRQLRDVGCVVLLNRIKRDIYEQRRLYVAAMRTKVHRPYQRPKTGLLFEETES